MTHCDPKPLLAAALTACGLSLLTLIAMGWAQELQTDPALEPPPQSSPPVTLPPLTSPTPAEPRVLRGGVRTLDQALADERNVVDWYGWYLACRQYLLTTGGFQCERGTSIQFYRSGQMEALSSDPLCQASVASKHFPLPPATRIDILVLPVRTHVDPPASREEIFRRTRGGS